MLIAIILALPLLGALCVAMLPKAEEQQQRHFGVFFSLVTFAVSLGLLAGFDAGNADMQLGLKVPWVKSLGISFHVGVDGISLFLVLLTTLLTPIVLLSSYKHIKSKVREFVVSMLVLEVGMLGAFVSLDLFLFYVFWEIMLVPMYLIIGIWGHERKVYAAIKFVIYTMIGSLLMLVAILYMYVTHGQATGNYTFDYLVLSQSNWGWATQHWLFLAFALAFAIKVPMFPLHTWLPDAHVEAPTAGSVILAGVLLKLGTYGFLRFAIPMFPWAAACYGPYITGLAVVGIIYGALVAYAQKDAKKLVAYSSVSHLGFVMLGLMAMTTTGIQGGIYQMLNHGLSTGGLFLAIGVLYDRRHTRLLSQFGGLWKRLPVFAGLFMIVMLSSAGLPGLNGFVGEFLILVGAFTHGKQMSAADMPIFIWHSRVVAAFAAVGVVLGAVYLLHLYQKLMFGPLSEANQELEDVSPRETWTFVPLIVLIFVMGIFPQPFLSRMEPAVKKLLKEYQVKFKASEREFNAGQRRNLPVAIPELVGTTAKSGVGSGAKAAPAAPGEVAPAVPPRERGDRKRPIRPRLRVERGVGRGGER
jgi:NADH-quinone oxidoreductase subunit M